MEAGFFVTNLHGLPQSFVEMEPRILPFATLQIIVRLNPTGANHLCRESTIRSQVCDYTYYKKFEKEIKRKEKVEKVKLEIIVDYKLTFER